jgi:flagellar basal-body rod protein FlgG
MLRGLYTAYTGMRNEQKRLDVISNNIANAATVGYKTESVSNQSFDDALTLKIKDQTTPSRYDAIGGMNLGVKIGEVYTDYGQGSLNETENPFDLAVAGKGFFNIDHYDANGQRTVKYTRDGSFTMANDGYVVTSNGDNILDVNGRPVRVNPRAAEISIDIDGNIHADNVLMGRIGLTDFADYDYIAKYGENLYQPVDGATQVGATGTIRQGYLEQSNVDSVSEMVDLITVTRAYEANQKIIQSMDTMLDKAVNDVGRV